MSNKGRALKDVASSADKFDTIEGQIDKNGDFIATFEFNSCGLGDCEEELILLEGNIKNDNKLYGRNKYEKVITFELIKEIAIGESSSTFDNSYSFMLTAQPPGQGINGIGHGCQFWILM